MNRLKLRQLQVFLEVYQRRKIAIAAERLAMTQSAVSTTLKQLEETVGTSLFDRTTRSLVPTQAAAELVQIAERMLRDARTAENMFRMRRVTAGRLAVVTTPTLAQTLVAGLVASFLQDCPDVHIDILDVPPPQFATMLASGQGDLGIGFLGHEDQELRQHRLLADYLSLVTNEERRLPVGASVTWKGIHAHPLALIRPGYGIREIIDQTARKTGASLQVSHEVGLVATALAMTAAGITDTIAPTRFAGMSLFPGLVAHKIREPMVKRDISLVLVQDRTPTLLARRFLEHCLDTTMRARSG